MQKKALMVGNLDGIGLAATRRLLTAEWDIIGISRSESLGHIGAIYPASTQICFHGFTQPAETS